jgi:hypothetical protein
MTIFTISAAEVFKPVSAAGDARGGDMGEARTWGVEVERVVNSVAASGGALVYTTRALLFADLAHAAQSMAWVVNDPTAANNGIYLKSGASGSGAWTRVGDLPFQVVTLSISGTANALVATSVLPVPAADRAALLIFNTPNANTGAATMAINGDAALPILDRYGNALTENFFIAGGAAIAVKSDGAIRTFLDTNAQAARIAAEAARDVAVDAKDDAEDARDVAVAAQTEIQKLYLGAKTSFPALDNEGNPLQTGVWFTLTAAVGPLGPGPYAWDGVGWVPLAASPESLPRGGYVLVDDAIAASGIVTISGGYAVGYVSIWRNGLKQRLGASPGTDPDDPNCDASDGETVVFPAGVLAKNNLIEWEYRRPFEIGLIDAADATVLPVGGITETNAQDALAGLDTRISALSVGADEGLFKLAVSDSAGTLTVALKTLAGADPSSGSPLVFAFPDGSGGWVKRQITSAFSATIPSGATLGASNGVALGVWPVLFDDAGALRMAFVNCRTATSVLRLRQHGSFDAVTPAANTAGVIYAAAAVSGKPIIVLGVLDWDTGLTTAGTWTAPTRTSPWQPGQPLPGEVGDFVALNAGAGSTHGGTSTTYQDVTGATLTLTRRRPQNAVRIMADAAASIPVTGASVNAQHQATLLRGSTDLGTTRTTGVASGSGGNPQVFGGIAMRFFDFPGNTLAATYKIQHRSTHSSVQPTTSAIDMEAQEIWA